MKSPGNASVFSPERITVTLKQSNTTIRGLLFQPLLAGLVCGMVWGWLQAARLALTTRHVMSLR
jgi:hypothetical protein